jgi:hypothetical protein
MNLFADPPGLLEKTEFLLRDWVNMYHSPSAGKESTKVSSSLNRVFEGREEGVGKETVNQLLSGIVAIEG